MFFEAEEPLPLEGLGEGYLEPTLEPDRPAILLPKSLAFFKTLLVLQNLYKQQ